MVDMVGHDLDELGFGEVASSNPATCLLECVQYINKHLTQGVGCAKPSSGRGLWIMLGSREEPGLFNLQDLEDRN